MFNGTPFTMNVTPTGTNGYGGCGGFGNDGWGMWIWVILIIAIFGWGNGGWGNNGSSTADTLLPYLIRQESGANDNYVLTSDFSNLSRQIDNATDGLRQQSTQIANGLCDGFYTQAQLVNGLDKSIAESNYALNNAITQSQFNAMQNTNAIGAQITALGTQMASCCCDQKYNTATQFADVNYRLATDTCAINTNLSNVARDIIDNDNANYRALDARLTAMESSAKDEKIAMLQSQLSDARLIANNTAQTASIESAISKAVKELTPPAPVASFQVPAPFPYSGCGCPCSCS